MLIIRILCGVWKILSDLAKGVGIRIANGGQSCGWNSVGKVSGVDQPGPACPDQAKSYGRHILTPYRS
jgi:hypothetical protein